MAMIRCPECGKPVPESADTCPSCDFPIADYLASLPEGKQPGMLTSEGYAPNRAAYRPSGASADRIYSQKLMLVIASGLALFILYALSLYHILGEFQFWPFLVLLLIFCIYAGPVLFCTLKRRKPAMILSSLMLLLAAGSFIAAVLSPKINMSGAWISSAVTLSSLVLLLLYSILGFRNWNSAVWIVAFLFIQAIGIFTPRKFVMDILTSAYDLPSGVTELLEVATFVVTCLYFVTGYSPDRWYRKGMW